MSQEHGPWGPHDPPPPPRFTAPRTDRTRLLLWLGLIAVAGAGVWALMRFAPSAPHGQDQFWAWYAFGLLVLVSRGVLFARNVKPAIVARNALIWVAAASACLLGYSYRGEISAAGERVAGALDPGLVAHADSHTLVVEQSEDGAFYLLGAVNGRPVRFLIDTGADDIVLSPADARRLGFDPARLDFHHDTETANGVGHGAPITLDSVTVGPIRLGKVSASVNATDLDTSLLGTPFLKSLQSFEIRDGRLYLRWRA